MEEYIRKNTDIVFSQHMDHIKAATVLMSELGHMIGRAFTSGTVGVPLPIR
jgi:hypothetical protein